MKPKLKIEEAKVEKYFSYDKNKLEVFVPFQKIDEEKKRAWAYLTTGDLDYDGQRVDMAAVARALPEYLEWGNVREMHQNKVAGVIQPENAKIDEVGLLGGIDILRDDVWELVKGGGYKGVSVGLSDVQVKKSEDTPNGVLTDGGPNGKPFKIIEVSLVDRPANPKCKIVAVKIAADGKQEVDGIKPVEKIALDGEVATPQKEAGADSKVAPASEKTLATFAANWAAGEMMDDLPKMVDTLFSTLGNIIYNPEGTAEEKSAAMKQSVEEFSAKCQEYMTGEKLAKGLENKVATETGKLATQVNKTDWAKLIAESTTDITGIFKAQLETLKTEFTDKLKEATSTIEKLQGDKVDLERRLKIVEETPLPPKSLSNPDSAVDGKTALGNMGLTELQALLLSMAKSPDPKMQAAASDLSKKLVIGMLGGDTGGK